MNFIICDAPDSEGKKVVISKMSANSWRKAHGKQYRLIETAEPVNADICPDCWDWVWQGQECGCPHQEAALKRRNVNLREDQVEWLNRRAKRQDATASALIRQAIDLLIRQG